MKISTSLTFEVKSTIGNLADKQDVKNLIKDGKAFVDYKNHKVFVFDSFGNRVDIAYIKSVKKEFAGGEVGTDPITLREVKNKRYMSIKEMIEHLESNGIHVASSTTGSDLCDAGINIDKDDIISLQVGSDYVIVNRWDKEREAIYHSPTSDRSYLSFITTVMTQIKLAQKEVANY